MLSDDWDVVATRSAHQEGGDVSTKGCFAIRETVPRGASKRAMDVTLPSVQRQYALVYLDEIIMFREPRKSTPNSSTNVLTLLPDTGLILKLKKRKFFTETFDCLDHVIRPKRFKVSSHTTHTIRGLKAATSFTKPLVLLGAVQSFQMICLRLC